MVLYCTPHTHGTQTGSKDRKYRNSTKTVISTHNWYITLMAYAGTGIVCTGTYMGRFLKLFV